MLDGICVIVGQYKARSPIFCFCFGNESFVRKGAGYICKSKLSPYGKFLNYDFLPIFINTDELNTSSGLNSVMLSGIQKFDRFLSES